MTTTDWRPNIGDYGVVQYVGDWRETWAAKLVCFGTNAKVAHAVVYVGHVEGFEKEQIVETNPGGAKFADWDKYGDNVTWSTDDLPAHCTPTTAQGQQIARNAISYIGTPYGTLDILIILFAQSRAGGFLKPGRPLEQQPWIVRRYMSSKRLICSQLVDRAYAEAGVHLFTAWISCLVSPGDLWRLLLSTASGVTPTHLAQVGQTPAV
jgi:hypothetical protein